MKKQFLIAGAVLVAVAVSVTAAYADHAWGNYHWARTSNPFTLKLGDNVGAVWDAPLALSRSDWGVSDVLDLATVQGLTNATKGRATPKNCVPTPGRIEVCAAKYGANGWLGLASIWANGDHITQATAKMNDTYFARAPYNTPAWRNLVMCQEIAHGFGLDHQDEAFDNPNLGTCMDYTSDPSTNQHPNAHDFEELEIIYAHLDGTTTIDQSAAVASGQVTDDPATWGREIRRSADGRASVYERDLGRGNKVLTHVFWAEPRGR